MITSFARASFHSKKSTTLVTLIGIAAVAVLVAGTGSAGAAFAACPSSNSPNEVVVAGGSSQTAKIGTQLESNLQVALANSNGCPLTGQLAGISVDFDAPGSGASGVFASTGSREVTVGTNANGVATAPTFTANDTAGSYTVDAHSEYGSVELYLSNTTSGVVSAITVAGVSSQEATVDSEYPQPLRAQVLDANGNPVQGVTVNFLLQTGAYGANASFLTGASQASATTDSAGQAISPLFVANGSPGRFAASASTNNISSVATYTLDNHATSNTLSATNTAAQTATIDGRYANPLNARLLDPAGQPIEGATVTFTLNPGASGAVASFLGGNAQATSLTDASGQATSPPFTANGTSGSFTATASVPGISTPLSYPLRNLAAKLMTNKQARTATVGHRYAHSLTAHVVDAQGHPVDGAIVTFAIGKATGGATASFPNGGSQTTATTDSVGIASSPPLAANSSAGSFTATASMGGGSTLRYSLRNLAGKTDAIAAGAADGESTPAGARFPIGLAVTVTDKDGNPVSGLLVTFSAPAHGPSGHFAEPHIRGKASVALRAAVRVQVRTDSKGVAIASAFIANGAPGGYDVTARVGGRRTAFALINSRQ